jgi:hypothetical protein
MKDLNNDELATIRIAILGKIDDMHKYLKDCENEGNYTGKAYWQESIVRHNELLNKLYSMHVY